MRNLLILGMALCVGCGLSGVRIDGGYEKDGEKFTGGTEWTFNEEKSEEEGEPILEKDGKEYTVIAKQDREIISDYFNRELPKTRVQNLPREAKIPFSAKDHFDLVIYELKLRLKNK